jgi:hypothetical protein
LEELIQKVSSLFHKNLLCFVCGLLGRNRWYDKAWIPAEKYVSELQELSVPPEDINIA